MNNEALVVTEFHNWEFLAYQGSNFIDRTGGVFQIWTDTIVTPWSDIALLRDSYKMALMPGAENSIDLIFSCPSASEATAVASAFSADCRVVTTTHSWKYAANSLKMIGLQKTRPS